MAKILPANGAGPKIWVRFLCRHLECVQRVLDTQLGKPLAPGEIFEWLKTPVPENHRWTVLPELFVGAYEFGRNPDGRYFKELEVQTPRDAFGNPTDDGTQPNDKYNLYERVCGYLPESAPWLLKDVSPYLTGDCPDIDFSVEVFERVLSRLGLKLLDDDCLQAWEQIDPQGLDRAIAASVRGLIECALPDSMALWLSMWHLSVWQGHSQLGWEPMTRSIYEATRHFVRSPVLHGTPEAHAIAQDIHHGIDLGTQAIWRDGTRSRTMRHRSEIPVIPRKLVLFESGADTEAATRCLIGGGDMAFNVMWHLPPEFCPDGLLPGPEALARAAKVLESFAERIPAALEACSIQALRGLRGQLPHRIEPEPVYTGEEYAEDKARWAAEDAVKAAGAA